MENVYDGKFNYNKIVSNLYNKYETFIKIFENSKDSLDFAERAFLEIEVSDGVYTTDVGLYWEDFSFEMLEFYRKVKAEIRKENIMKNREFYVVRNYEGYYSQIYNEIVSTKEEAEEILEEIYSTYNLEEYSYNKSDDLLTIEKYTIKDDNIKDFETLEEILEKTFYEEQIDILDYYNENKEDNKFFTIEETDNYIYQGMETDGIGDKLDEIREAEKKYNDNYLQAKVDKLCSNFQEAINKCVPPKQPIGFGNYATLDGKMRSCKDGFYENLKKMALEI